MFKVIIFLADDDGFWISDEKDFDSFSQALNYAVKSELPYEIYKDYYFVSAIQLVARSIYELWSR